MKLNTEITPRTDGTVTAVVPAIGEIAGAKYRFADSGDGLLSATVENEAHVGYLLDTGHFYPAEEKDIAAGLDAVRKAEAEAQAQADAEAKAKDEAEAKAKKEQAAADKAAAKAAKKK